jgi:3,4-dihydroxy 2-butanone 4-phosphate synthase/GTP cyclohydrolase II
MHPIPDILDDLRHGKMVVLVDDADRENEGDLVCAGQFASAETVNFMLREGRGMMCVALGGEVGDRLKLEPQSAINTSRHSTAYTVTVDAAQHHGVTTGVSAADRAATIQKLAAPTSQPADFDRPGHMQPLRARDGGTLVRAGQTEGSVDLCRLAGLEPAAVIIEIMNPDGSMARRDDLEKLCAQHDIKMASVADVIEYRLQRDKLVRRIDSMPFENDLGRFNLIAYHSEVDPMPHVALTCGEVGRLDDFGQPIDLHEPVLVRMHSQNLLGDVFGDCSQPSGQTLRQAMRMIQDEGRGAIVYLRHEGMGSGLLKRLQTAHRQSGEGPGSTVRLGEAQPSPGIEPPKSNQGYGIGSQILRDLGLRQLRLITNHPFTPTALSGFGLSIDEFVPIETDQR